MNSANNIHAIDRTMRSAKAPEEYWELMSAEMNNLYLLAFLLTADMRKAEQCLAEALDEFVDGLGDFLDWARAEGRQAILRHAIRTVRPKPEIMQDWMDLSLSEPKYAGDCRPLGAITSLRAFERFVFVMIDIEGQFAGECAKLLTTTEVEVGIARELAERMLATSNYAFNPC